MISFACPHCAVKLTVQPRFAGRSAKCPACKQPLVVPTPDATAAQAPAGDIDGTPSSLHRAGVDAGVTLGPPAGAAADKSFRDLLTRRTTKQERYVVAGEIARGGMGAVLRAVDCDIRREVAVKYLLDQTDANKKLRFVEEAQITGQLEHPNIVPIHELGVDAQKRLFFAMKMVKGRSLAQILDALREDPKAAEKEWSLGRLLNVFTGVCHALAYAHSRGIVHRDLKPANIMVGDFGEVYVMDWGLAKVLASGGRQPPEKSNGDSALDSGGSRPPLAASVTTSREPEADLTQEGAVVGTPAYMPPEQAAGKLQAVDARSDVYSLGAILYEMLTLQAPVEKDGGYLAVLLRVMEGQIVPPEQRAPGRARAGKVPKELAAVAMKALAKQPEERYPSAEALRRDVERYQEGRSVSARHDTVREAVWRLVKRNKAVSGVAAAAVVLLAVVWGRSSWVNYQERTAREGLMRQAVPSFLRAARAEITEGRFKDALAQVTLALENDPGHDGARLLKGQLLIADKQFGPARDELDVYVRRKPDDADARRLAELCRDARPEDTASVQAFVPILQRQKEYALAERLIDSREELIKAYRKRIEDAWPKQGSQLQVGEGGKLSLSLAEGAELPVITDLEPLRGIPLATLYVRSSKVTNIAPLEGMKLTSLGLTCPVRDLAPLKGMPLATLNLYGCQRLEDLSPLKGLRPTTLSLSHCSRVTDLAPLKDMPLTSLDLYGCGLIRDLGPLEGMPLTRLVVASGHVRDLSPPEGMPLTTLHMSLCTGVRDLTPLEKLPLTGLDLWGCSGVHDLAPLRNLPLRWLNLGGVPAEDLSPLANVPLEEFYFTPRNVKKGIGAVRDKSSLKVIGVGGKAEERWPAAEFWKKYDAKEFTK